jgi:hypothetical protein
VPFAIAKDQAVLIHAIGEGVQGRMADYAWIEDAKTGKPVWTMEFGDTQPAGGGSKNRMVEARITLTKGGYTLRFKTDDTHAYGDWNAAPPRNPERYGVSVYAAGE